MTAKKPPADKPRKLSLMEAKFVREYPLCRGNGTQAAIKAGYNPKRAKQSAWELMQRPHVKAAIGEVITRGLSKLDVTVDRVLQERARLAFFDARKLFRPDGTPIPLHELDDDTAAAVQGVKLGGHFEGRGKARKFVTTIDEYKLPAKDPNLTALDKYLGLYREEASSVGIFNIHLHLKD
jgi:phage terminase small subunit